MTFANKKYKIVNALFTKIYIKHKINSFVILLPTTHFCF